LDPKTRLVLFRLVDSGVLEEVNGAISTGKEAVVFHGTRKLDPADPESATEEVAVKVFKTMLTEFKQRQQFLHGDRRFEDRVGRQSARKLVKLWAEKESANLIRMDRGGMHCPKVVTQNKHVLAMTFLGKDGVPAQKLKNVELSIKGFDRIFEDVKNAMHTMYHTCRLVHADLSEYNILYHNKKPYFIDVGQSVEPTHPRADAYLLRDCVQICRFFKSAGVTNPMEPRDLFSATCGKSLTADEAVELQQEVISSRAAYSRRGKGNQEDLSDVCTKMNLNSMSLKPDAEEGDPTSSSNESGDAGFVMVENDNPKEEEDDEEEEKQSGAAITTTADSKFVLINHEEAMNSDEQVSKEE
jgi:RIO kinase 3